MLLNLSRCDTFDINRSPPGVQGEAAAGGLSVFGVIFSFLPPAFRRSSLG